MKLKDASILVIDDDIDMISEWLERRSRSGLFDKFGRIDKVD